MAVVRLADNFWAVVAAPVVPLQGGRGEALEDAVKLMCSVDGLAGGNEGYVDTGAPELGVAL